MKLGDKFTINVPVRRKCWQVWKPKGVERVSQFDVIGCATSIKIGASDIRYEGFIRDWRIKDLKQQIETARRNKKKSSHLVAELKKLEEQK